MIKTFKDLKDRKWKFDGIPKWIFKTGPFTIEDLPELMKEIYLDILKKKYCFRQVAYKPLQNCKYFFLV